MDNKKLKEIVGKKLVEYYIQNQIQQNLREIEKRDFNSEIIEAVVVLEMLDYFENPRMLWIFVKKMNLCSDILCVNNFFYDAILECCTPEEALSFKEFKCLSTYSQMTDQEREQFEEEVMGLLERRII